MTKTVPEGIEVQTMSRGPMGGEAVLLLAQEFSGKCPWTFDVVLHRKNCNRTGEFYEIMLERRKEACAVAPAQA